MPNIKLKNKQGTENVYTDINKIKVIDENNGEIEYTYNNGSLDILSNGVYNVDGKETVNVKVNGGSVSLQDKTVSPTVSQQIIKADDDYDGLNTVTISAVTASIDSNIIASNIKKGVSVLGVDGTYEDISVQLSIPSSKVTEIVKVDDKLYLWRDE